MLDSAAEARGGRLQHSAPPAAEAAAGHEALRTWKGFRLAAVDGTTVILPDTINLRGHFGVSGSGDGVAPARAPAPADVLNGIVMDAATGKCP
jgi:hypothetical protein